MNTLVELERRIASLSDDELDRLAQGEDVLGLLPLAVPAPRRRWTIKMDIDRHAVTCVSMCSFMILSISGPLWIPPIIQQMRFSGAYQFVAQQDAAEIDSCEFDSISRRKVCDFRFDRGPGKIPGWGVVYKKAGGGWQILER